MRKLWFAQKGTFSDRLYLMDGPRLGFEWPDPDRPRLCPDLSFRADVERHSAGPSQSKPRPSSRPALRRDPGATGQQRSLRRCACFSQSQSRPSQERLCSCLPLCGHRPTVLRSRRLLKAATVRRLEQTGQHSATVSDTQRHSATAWPVCS